jgi:stringent starvation protein B
MFEGKKTYISAAVAVLAILAAKLGFNFDFNGLDNDILALLGAVAAIWARKVAKV